jgi:hypothetical protein
VVLTAYRLAWRNTPLASRLRNSQCLKTERKLHPTDEDINRIIDMVRTKVEHPFRVIKRQVGHMKFCYHILVTNRAQVVTLFALGSLFLLRKSQLSWG